jgi:hypothetical protein
LGGRHVKNPILNSFSSKTHKSILGTLTNPFKTKKKEALNDPKNQNLTE